MSKVLKLFEKHISHLRELAIKKSYPFEAVLRSVMESPESNNYCLADILEKPEEVESRLIKIYQVEFFEWLANELMNSNESTLKAFAERRANEIISEKNRIKAFARHAENYAMKEQAINYWNENIDKSLSNEQAATLLLKVVPLSHRKLSQYVSEARKKNTPC